MKICQIGPFPLNASCIQGGVEASVYGLSMELAKTNQVFVIDIPRYEIKSDFIEKNDQITSYRFSAPSQRNFTTIFRLKKIVSIIRVQQPDLCHIHTTSLFSLICYISLKLLHFPCIVTVHGLAHIEKRNVWHKRHSLRNLLKYWGQSITEFLYLSICPILIADTEYVANTIKHYKNQRKIFKMPICKVIPQGVNSDFFQLKKSIERNHLLAVGAINRRKGHLNLIEAMKKVKLQIPDFFLSIVGVVSDGDYYKLIQSTILEYDLENNIKIYPNASFVEIQVLFKKSELFVLHSEEESQGIVFCEAMAAGIPIVATNVGGIPWIVENNVNGLLSDFGDINTFADNVIKLLKNGLIRSEIAKRNRLESFKYDWYFISNEIMNLYKTMI
ncbi:glycosyl transferase group 1 [Paludibacter propionicigenes WB4]|uniref:Glycosyl transferase group 1 n=1 Tax=Paludibacter propionicigenes (strain DSM 17365 / JCM 13257 / WB4) TaxID=694427 RepID=E4T3I2_PALPW|nr:glycosyltransferase family 4 protein [Paludibacter propionicigenes]ADQ79276.1 glycosyl transferase group 1 [Paludibacter propionicigenes WB4]